MFGVMPPQNPKLPHSFTSNSALLIETFKWTNWKQLYFILAFSDDIYKICPKKVFDNAVRYEHYYNQHPTVQYSDLYKRPVTWHQIADVSIG